MHLPPSQSSEPIAIEGGPSTKPEATEGVDSGGANPTVLTDMLGGGLLVAGVLGLVFIFVRKLRKNKQKHFEMDLPPRERIDRLHSGASSTNDMHAVTARAQESVQTLITQLENKAVRLESLLDRAESRIAELEARFDAASDGLARREEHNAAPRPAIAMTREPDSPPADPLHARVHALADQGLNPVEIARQVDRPTGQIELILALRRA